MGVSIMKIKTWPDWSSNFRNERGVSAVFVSITLFIFLTFTALAVDFGHLYGVRNELQNAADAAALAGAYHLIQNDGSIKTTVKADAEEAGEKNPTGNVDIIINQDDVLVGHWSFAAAPDPETAFVENNNTYQVSNWTDRTLYGEIDPLDSDEDFINAVKVTVRRTDTPSFFARIFGEKYDFFSLTATAVAYIGFTANAPPDTVDLPYALCNQYISKPGGTGLECGVGRAAGEQDETGGWTGFDQAISPEDKEADNCGAARHSDNYLRDLLNDATVDGHPCQNVNPGEISFGEKIVTDNGNKVNVTKDIMDDCFTAPTSLPFNERMVEPLNVDLLVVDCQSTPGNYTQTCTEKAIKVVNVDIIWITDNNINQAGSFPTEMTATVDGVVKEFRCPNGTNYLNYTPEQCWSEFVSDEYFNLQLHDGSRPDPMSINTFYFLPNCEEHEPAGNTGNVNSGIPAIIPVLVYPVTS